MSFAPRYSHVLVCGIAIVSMVAFPRVSLAEIQLDGWLIATKSCPALQSIRKQTNPGPVQTEVDRAYPLFGKNNDAATHFLIGIKGAEPERRWVETGCGIHVVAASGDVTPPSPQPNPQPGPAPAGSVDYVLAASWQPGFCETKTDKTECASQTADRFDATHLALHGLWPQPRSNVYCNVSSAEVADDKAGRWDRLPAPVLTPETKAALDTAMPGTQSMLERHEWIKHGSCDGGSTEEYFADSVRLMAALNNSGVQQFFAGRIGMEATSDEIREAFDAAFGPGAGDRVKVSCVTDPSNGRRLIGELTIGLTGDITPDAKLADLIFAAAPTDPGCPAGIVDEAGFQ